MTTAITMIARQGIGSGTAEILVRKAVTTHAETAFSIKISTVQGTT